MTITPIGCNIIVFKPFLDIALVGTPTTDKVEYGTIRAIAVSIVDCRRIPSKRFLFCKGLEL